MATPTLTLPSISRQVTTDTILMWLAREFVLATTDAQRTLIVKNVRANGYSGVQFRAAIAAAEQAR